MTNLKALVEERAELKSQLEEIVNKADIETRALNEEEIRAFDELETKIKNIDATIKVAERVRNMENKEIKKDVEERAEVIEERAFLDYIKRNCGVAVENRAGEQNFTMGNNGAVIPTSIANRIISTVKEMCPIFEKSTMFSVKGTLKVPVYGLSNTTHDITVSYADEFSELTADAGAFSSVDLSSFLAGALTLIGKSVINNSDIDVVSFIIKQISKKVVLFLEKELINGTTNKAEGALSTTNNLSAGSTSSITADNLIDLKAKVPTVYQANAAWTMHPDTFKAIKKLKYGDGKYIFEDDMILGKTVYLSDNMPTIASGAKAVLYGDYSGLGVNMPTDVELQILNEKYATQNAIGIICWFSFDSDVIDNQMLATLTMSAS